MAVSSTLNNLNSSITGLHKLHKLVLVRHKTVSQLIEQAQYNRTLITAIIYENNYRAKWLSKQLVTTKLAYKCD